jgi:hypothetical protein
VGASRGNPRHRRKTPGAGARPGHPAAIPCPGYATGRSHRHPTGVPSARQSGPGPDEPSPRPPALISPIAHPVGVTWGLKEGRPSGNRGSENSFRGPNFGGFVSLRSRTVSVTGYRGVTFRGTRHEFRLG